MKTRVIVVRVLMAVFCIAVSNTVWSLPNGFLMSAGVDDEDIANGYYATIDPDNKRTTQADWLEVNGFNDPINEVVVAKGHFNNGDLRFYRVIKMVKDMRPGYQKNYAYTTGNYNTEADALAEVNSVSLVNMEFSKGPNDDRITKFYVYDEASDSRRTSTVFDETNTELHLPAACYSCHGGDDNEVTRSPDGYNEGSGETNSTFIAFDVRTMKFFGTSKASLEDSFKKLNKGILHTDPTKATKELIKGLYGGSGLPRATQDINYIPSDWAGEEELYSKVIVPNCLSCHTASDSKILRLSWWKENPDKIREEVYHEMKMPDSLPAYNQFWNETNQHEIVLEALNRFESSVSGIPGPATLVSPSGSISDSTPTYTWNAVSGSTWYYLWVSDSSSGSKVQLWYTAATAGCASGSGTCSVTPTTALSTGNGKWWIQTWNDSGYGPWSTGQAFNLQ